jgi:hypothetical protein
MLWTDTELGPLFAYLEANIPGTLSVLEKKIITDFFNVGIGKECDTKVHQRIAAEALNTFFEHNYITKNDTGKSITHMGFTEDRKKLITTHLIEFFKSSERATCNLKLVDTDPARLYDNASDHVNQYGPLVNNQRGFKRNSKTSWNVTFSAVQLFNDYTENKKLYSGYGFLVTKSDDAKNSLRVGDFVIQVGDTNVTEHTTLKEVTEALSIVAIVPPMKPKGGSKKKRRTRKKRSKKKRRTRNKSISILK